MLMLSPKGCHETVNGFVPDAELSEGLGYVLDIPDHGPGEQTRLGYLAGCYEAIKQALINADKRCSPCPAGCRSAGRWPGTRSG
jgi:hypothetical protein